MELPPKPLPRPQPKQQIRRTCRPHGGACALLGVAAPQGLGVAAQDDLGVQQLLLRLCGQEGDVVIAPTQRGSEQQGGQAGWPGPSPARCETRCSTT